MHGPSRLRIGIRVIAALVMMSPGAVVGQTREVTDAQVAAAALERATYGLPSDHNVVRAIMETGQDTGSARWGIVLTEPEQQALDLPGRMAFAVEAEQSVVAAAERLAVFGGAYYDQARGGRLVILLTELEPTTESRLRALSPDPAAVEFRRVDVEQRKLDVALETARAVWSSVAGGRPLPAVGVDERSNSVRRSPRGS